jgi:hypothetical protein
MADWYIAPDGVTKTGLTFSTIGASGYGHAWTAAVKWSEFTNAAGCWVNRADGDIFHFLACNKPYTLGGGWVNLVWNKINTTWSGETIDGRKSVVMFVGHRDWPWPKAGQTAVNNGEVMISLQPASAGGTTTYDHIGWKNMKTATFPNIGNNADIGAVVFKDCIAFNVSRGLLFTEGRSDGRCTLTQTNCTIYGMDKGNARTWANNAGVGYVQTDCYWDSEHQNDNSNYNNASTPSGGNLFDARPETITVKSPSTAVRVVSVNNRAGYTAPNPGYPQGDGLISEENAAPFTAIDVLTWGNGDRGIDLKAYGTIRRHTSLGDGTAALAHHQDTQTVAAYNCVYYSGARLTTSNSPPSVSTIQASGLLDMYQSWMQANPTVAQDTLAATAISNGSVDPTKWQHAQYGGVHIGAITLHDCYLRWNATTGATETNGYTGTTVNGRVGIVFGLAASSTHHYVVRALGPDWTAGPATTPSITFAMSADGGGDRTGPAAPTNFVATAGADGRDIVFTWTPIAEDAGVSIQGYVIEVDAGDGAGFVPFLPARSASPITLSGFRKNHSYTARVKAFDNNMNLGTASATSTCTTAAGTDVVDTPSVPQAVGADGGWVGHVTCAGIGNSNVNTTTGFNAPATGTVSVYEILDADNANAVVTRMGSVRVSSQAVPSYTKVNCTTWTI